MRVLAVIGALALIVAIGLGAYFLGGFYSVAATQDDPAFVKSILERTREASIARHATVNPPDNLADEANVRAGARVFQSLGCSNCHGAPGVGWAKFSEGMRPDPPDLKEVVGERTPQQLFWVIKHGINMTGMPSFAKVGASDEDIWKVVAFLKKLPGVSEADFRSWTAAASPAAP